LRRELGGLRTENRRLASTPTGQHGQQDRQKQNKALEEQARPIHQEQKTVLRTLLGDDAMPANLAVPPSAEALSAQAKYMGVPEHKRSQVLEMMEKYQRMEQTLPPGRDGRINSLEVQKLQQQAREQLALILTPEELV
jgi:hypothetical protein